MKAGRVKAKIGKNIGGHDCVDVLVRAGQSLAVEHCLCELAGLFPLSLGGVYFCLTGTFRFLQGMRWGAAA